MAILREKAETARTDAVQKFKTSQSFIDSCADYYGTGFDDCLKLDLSGISMDAPARNVIVDDDDGIPKSHPSPKVDGGFMGPSTLLPSLSYRFAISVGFL